MASSLGWGQHGPNSGEATSLVESPEPLTLDDIQEHTTLEGAYTGTAEALQ